MEAAGEVDAGDVIPPGVLTVIVWGSSRGNRTQRAIIPHPGAVRTADTHPMASDSRERIRRDRHRVSYSIRSNDRVLYAVI